MQQGFLRAILRTLQQRLAAAQEARASQTLQARCALVARLQAWQRQTGQRVVNAVHGWSAAQQCLVWSLTLGVPEALLAQSATHVAA